jgi:DNA-binding ferritin-like protein
MKVEREFYRIKRPQPLTTRDVFVKLAEPVDLSTLIDEYHSDAHEVRHKLTNALHEKIQSMVDELVERAKAAGSSS